MGKGIAVKTVFELFIAAIILFLLSPLIIRVTAQVWETIMISLGLITPSNVERAIECSYYRCTEGCASVKMNEISWVEGTETVNCQKFCKDESFYEGDDLKICKNSALYPVTVTISKTPYVNQKHISTVATCVLTPDSYSAPVLSWDENYVFLDDSVKLKNIVKTDDCAGRLPEGTPRIGNAIESADIEDKTVYISTYNGGCPISWCSGWNNLVTEITAKNPAQGCKPSGAMCGSYNECCSHNCYSGKCAG